MKKLSVLLCLFSLAGCMATAPQQSNYPEGTYEIKVFEQSGRQISQNARLPVKDYEIDATLDAVCKIHAGKGVTARVYNAERQELAAASPRVCR